MLAVFDDVLARIPKGRANAADREITAIRRARRAGGRRTRRAG
jgi:hypothetical protein